MPQFYMVCAVMYAPFHQCGCSPDKITLKKLCSDLKQDIKWIIISINECYMDGNPKYHVCQLKLLNKSDVGIFYELLRDPTKPHYYSKQSLLIMPFFSSPNVSLNYFTQNPQK